MVPSQKNSWLERYGWDCHRRRHRHHHDQEEAMQGAETMRPSPRIWLWCVVSLPQPKA